MTDSTRREREPSFPWQRKTEERRRRYAPSHGYMTKKAQSRYLAKLREMDPEGAEKLQSMPQFLSLEASDDESLPLMFWQLFSILGPNHIQQIIQDFYTRVWNDEEAPWFREAFVEIVSFERAVWTQAAMWRDCFGGGKTYHGSEYRLAFHHSMVQPVMTRRGAERWLFHMRATLDEAPAVKPKRIRRAINDFLWLFMNKYSKEFTFDPDGLDFGDEQIQCLALSPSNFSRAMEVGDHAEEKKEE